MAAGDGHVVNNFKEQLLLGTVNCATNTFKIALYSDAYAASQIDGAAPAYSATNEINPGAPYTAGGQSVGTCVVAQDDTNDRASWASGGNVLWTALPTATIQRAVLYDDTTTPKHQAIIWEIGTNSNGGNYTLQWTSNIMMYLS